MTSKYLLSSSIVAAALLLNACSSAAESKKSDAGDLSVSMSGLVVDGPVSGATVCISGTTYCVASDADGKYTFSGIKLSELSDPVKIVATGGTDTATNKTVGSSIKTAINKPTSSVQANLSPLTTLVAQTVENGKSVSEAQTKVSTILDINVDKIDDNPMEDQTVFAKTQKIVQMKNIVNSLVTKNSSGLSSDDIENLILDSIVGIDSADQLTISNVIDTVDNDAKVNDIPQNQLTFAVETMDKIETALDKIEQEAAQDDLDSIQKSLDDNVDEAEDKIEDADDEGEISGVIISDDPDELAAQGEKENPITTIDNLTTRAQANQTDDAENAKDLIKQLRNTTDSVYKESETGEQSGLSISQKNSIEQKVEPALENIENQVDEASTALDSMLDAFSASIDNAMQFQAVQDTADYRLRAIDEIWPEEKTSLTAAQTYYGDTLSVTYDEQNNHYDVSIIGPNTTNITFSYDVEEVDGEERVKNASITSGKFAIGEYFNFEITALSLTKSFENGKNYYAVSFSAQGTVDTEVDFNGNASFSIKAVNNMDEIILEDEILSEVLPEFGLVLDGTLSVEGRTFEGVAAFDLQDSTKNEFDGKLTGLSGEPTIEGKFNFDIKASELDKVTRDYFGYGNIYILGKIGDNYEFFKDKEVSTSYKDGNYEEITTYTTVNAHTIIRTQIYDGITAEILSTEFSGGEVVDIQKNNFKLMLDDLGEFEVESMMISDYLNYFYNHDTGQPEYNSGLEVQGSRCDEKNTCETLRLQYNFDTDTVSAALGFYTELTQYTGDVTLSHVEEIVRFRDIEQIYSFKGNLAHKQTNVFIDMSAGVDSEKKNLLNIKTLELNATGASILLSNAKMTQKELSSDDFISTNTYSFSFDKLEAKIKDTDDQELLLKFAGTMSGTETHNSYYNNFNEEFNKFDMNLEGTYSYGETTFNGTIKVSSTDNDTYSNTLNNATLEFGGEFSSSEIDNFSLYFIGQFNNSIDASGDDEEAYSAKLLFSKETGATEPYNFAMEFSRYTDTDKCQDGECTHILIVDSNNVYAKGINYLYEGASEAIDFDSKTILRIDDGMILYGDNTTESLE